MQWNTLGTALEIYSKKNEKLWEIPVRVMGRSNETDAKYRDYCTRITDLDADGNMEVITGASYLEGESLVENVLRVFDSEGHLLSKWSFGAPVTFNGTAYSNLFSIMNVEVLGQGGSHPKEILVGLVNERSPFCLTRLDNTGKILGEYWNFGWLGGLRTLHLEGEDHRLVLLCGLNEVEYQSNNVYPILTILDPARIEGRRESVKTRGFGFEASQAELYYVRCGNVDPSLVTGTKVQHPSFRTIMKLAPDSSFTVRETFLVPKDFPEVLYTFDKHMALLGVWLPDEYRLTLMDKFLAKKTRAGFDEFRLGSQEKGRVLGWRPLRKEPTKIVSTLP